MLNFIRSFVCQLSERALRENSESIQKAFREHSWRNQIVSYRQSLKYFFLFYLFLGKCNRSLSVFRLSRLHSFELILEVYLHIF